MDMKHINTLFLMQLYKTNANKVLSFGKKVLAYNCTGWVKKTFIWPQITLQYHEFLYFLYKNNICSLIPVFLVCFGLLPSFLANQAAL